MPLVQCIARAADKRKAEGVTALRVSHLTVTTEFFVNLVGNSRPQNQAIAAAITDDVAEHFGGRKPRNEGTADSGWILLDYGEVIVNIMTPRSREYYDLESFWKDAQPLDITGVLLPNLSNGGSSTGEDWGASAEDPFWGESVDEKEILEPGDLDVIASAGDVESPEAAAAGAADPFWDLSDDDAAASGASSGEEEDPFWS